MDGSTPACGDSVRIRRFKRDRWESPEDTVSREEALTVIWSDTVLGLDGTVKLWAWPHDPASLALGHALLDCLPGPAARRGCRVSADGERQFSVDLGREDSRPRPLPPSTLDPARLLEAMRAFIREQGLWEGTGCFHRAGIYAPARDRLLTRAEDIGRHNCIDRLAGWGALTDAPLTDTALLTTARFTASLCAKALRAGFRVLVSRSAVTSAAVALAARHGATLVGFARPDEERLSVFTDGPGRFPESSPGLGADAGEAPRQSLGPDATEGSSDV